MNVTFDASLWHGSQEEKTNYQKINTAFHFTEGGQNRIIPCIYTFTEGIVFDIITPLVQEQIHKYIELYAILEADNTMTDIQREIVLAKCPYQSISIKSIYWNGKKSDSFSSSSMGTAGELSDGDSLIMEQIKEAYTDIIKNTDCFYCQRMCVSFDDFDYTKESMVQITMITYEKYEKAELSLKLWVEEGKTAQTEMIHPFTGKHHTIWIKNDGLESVQMKEEKISFFAGTAEIAPPLMEGERLLFNSSATYAKKEAGTVSAGSVTVIGGACGPTAIFLANASKPKTHYGGQIMLCYSKPVCVTEPSDDEVILEASCFMINGMQRLVSSGEKIVLSSKNFQGN